MVFSVDSSEVVMVYDSQVVMNSDRVLSTQPGIGIGSDETGVCARTRKPSRGRRRRGTTKVMSK